MKQRHYYLLVIFLITALVGSALILSIISIRPYSAKLVTSELNEKEFQYFVVQLASDTQFKKIIYGEYYTTEFYVNIPPIDPPEKHVVIELNYNREEEKFNGKLIMEIEEDFTFGLYDKYKNEHNNNINPIVYSRLFTINDGDTLYKSKIYEYKFDKTEFPSVYCIQFSKWIDFGKIEFTDTIRYKNQKPVDIQAIHSFDTIFVKESFKKFKKYNDNHEIYARIIGINKGEYYKSSHYYHFIDNKLLMPHKEWKRQFDSLNSIKK